jgi:hypothetical protein
MATWRLCGWLPPSVSASASACRLLHRAADGTMPPPSMVACRLSMSRNLPHVSSSVIGRVSESIIDSPPIIVVVGRMSTRLVMSCVKKNRVLQTTHLLTRRGSGYRPALCTSRSRAGGCQNQPSDLHERKN